MTAILALLSGPLGRWAAYAAIAACVVTALAVGWYEHDQRILAEQAAREAAAVAVQQLADARAATAAVQAEAEAAIARANAATTIKTEIHRAPPTIACAASPAVRAALDGLRRPAAGDRPPGDPGRSLVLPARPGAPSGAP